jgi:hypothetical protein
LIGFCHEGLTPLLEWSGAEKEFLDNVLDKGEIRPELLTEDTELQKTILTNPVLIWKCANVRTFSNISK